MTKSFLFGRPFALTAGTAAVALLSACGGGGDNSFGLSLENAQGYAADGATMPVAAATGVDSATQTLESSLATAAAAAAGREQAQGASVSPDATASVSVACPNGGTIAWTVTGTDATLLGNGRLAAGETYNVTYTACGTADADSSVLDGQVQITVATRTATDLDATHSTTNLKLTTATGATYTLNGSTRVQRNEVTTTGGGRQVTRHITSPGISLASHVPLTGGGSRDASYQLDSYDWTVVRTYNAAGSLVSRSHSGHLVAEAHTPRRPDASLEITTEGTLTLDGSDGASASGSFTVVTSRNTIACTYGGGMATLTLDIGNDGTIDRTWRLTRTDFIGEAG